MSRASQDWFAPTSMPLAIMPSRSSRESNLVVVTSVVRPGDAIEVDLPPLPHHPLTRV